MLSAVTLLNSRNLYDSRERNRLLKSKNYNVQVSLEIVATQRRRTTITCYKLWQPLEFTIG